MVHELLELPPEILVEILGLLPVRSLLKFSETCRPARFLANSNLHALSLGIRPIRTWPCIADPSDKIYVQIQDACRYDYSTLLNFQSALVQSILFRHADTLQTLDLSLWTLTKPMAESIATLPALRSLSISVEHNMYARAVPRSCVAWERREQDKAWGILAKAAVWKDRLHVLRLDNVEVTTEQLAVLLQRARGCRALQLSRCKYVDRGLWDFLGSDWCGRASLQSLELSDIGGGLGEAAFEAIAGLGGLRHLNLYGCCGTERDQVQNWNKEVWHIPSIVLPAEVRDMHDFVLEVDPAYMVDDAVEPSG